MYVKLVCVPTFGFNCALVTKGGCYYWVCPILVMFFRFTYRLALWSWPLVFLSMIVEVLLESEQSGHSITPYYDIMLYEIINPIGVRVSRNQSHNGYQSLYNPKNTSLLFTLKPVLSKILYSVSVIGCSSVYINYRCLGRYQEEKVGLTICKMRRPDMRPPPYK